MTHHRAPYRTASEHAMWLRDVRHASLTVACPACGCGVGVNCVSRSGGEQRNPHRLRVEAVRARRREGVL